jgi:hypothetical protein
MKRAWTAVIAWWLRVEGQVRVWLLLPPRRSQIRIDGGWPPIPRPFPPPPAPPPPRSDPGV